MSTTNDRFAATEALLQLQDRQAFEAALPRIVLAGAATALLLGLLPVPSLSLSLTILAASALSVTAFAGDRLDRVLLSAPALALPALRWLPAHPTWQLASAGAVVGVLWVQAERCRLRFEVPLSPRLPGGAHFCVSALSTAGLTVWGGHVGGRLATWLASGGAPLLLVSAFAGATLALFASIGRLVAHIGREEDPLLNRVRHLLPRLSDEAGQLMQRALRSHGSAQNLLVHMPETTTREAWARTLRRALESLVDRAEDLAQLPPPDGAALRRQRLERESLSQRLERTEDPATRAQLAEALEAMAHEARERASLRVAGERTVAQLHAGCALMEQGELALHRTRHALAADRAEALASASRHLRALSQLDPSGVDVATNAPAPEMVREEMVAGATEPEVPLAPVPGAGA
ncbi:MAG TPA: hypothetical protein VK013_16600 [Myxococcaceae bacterium]|nr:hypothetical protein [Myxococcaceae bacterium]